jgi:hypothetical protein
MRFATFRLGGCFQRGMHLAPEFRALSRWGQVPVLEHEGRVLVQSAAILEYLAAVEHVFLLYQKGRDSRMFVVMPPTCCVASIRTTSDRALLGG